MITQRMKGVFLQRGRVVESGNTSLAFWFMSPIIIAVFGG
jgi:hypothetical protein